MRVAAAFAVSALMVVPAMAGPTAADLSRALLLQDVTAILQEEGAAYAGAIERDMLPGGGGQLWDQTVEQLYDPERLRAVLDRALETDMSTDAISDAVAFFETEQGQTILELENAARRAMADPVVEEAAELAYEELRATGSDRLDQIDRFVEANDLIERNVAGALSSNYQFFRGLSDGGSFVMSDEDILADVYGQEPDVRRDTETWLFAFLLMAYQPLEPEVMEDYVAFSSTQAGRELNAALFEGFEAMYRDISYALGLAASKAMTGSDL